MHIYPLQIDPTPPTIEHRYLGNHYIKYISYIEQCIYTNDRLTAPLSQLSIDAFHTATPNLADLADIAQCTYSHGKLTPAHPPIEHRSLENQYTKYVSYIPLAD